MTHLTYGQIQTLADESGGMDERRPLLDHVASCPRCARELTVQQSIARTLRQAPLVRVSRGFTQRVMEQVLPGKGESWLLRMFGGMGRILAMGFVLVMIGFVLTRSLPDSTTAKQSQPSGISKTLTDFYTQASQLLLKGSGQMSQEVTRQSSTEQSKIFAMTIVSLFALALLDRFVFRKIMKMKM